MESGPRQAGATELARESDRPLPRPQRATGYTTADEPRTPSEGAVEGSARTRRLWVHAAVLAAVLVAILGVLRPSVIAVPDEGLYLAQAEALGEGGWTVRREAVDVDVDGELSRLQPEAVSGDVEIPYARHAAYPIILTPAFWFGEYIGTLLVSLLGLWGAALSGALIARRIDDRLSIPTLWLIGAGSPLVFYGFVTMAHTLAAAAAGFAFLGITRWLDDRRPAGLLYGVPALWLALLVRSEGTIYALAVAAAVGLMAIAGTDNRPDAGPDDTAEGTGHADRTDTTDRTDRADTADGSCGTASTGGGERTYRAGGTGRAAPNDSAHGSESAVRAGGAEPATCPDPVGSGGLAAAVRRVDLRALATAVFIGVSAVITYFLDTQLDDAITGNAGYGMNPAAIATRSSADPIAGSWASLLRPFANDWSSGALWVTIAALCTLGASLLLRRRPDRWRPALGLLIVGAAAAVCMFFDPPWLVTGLLAAFPLLAAGLIWLRRSDLSAPLVNRIVLVVVITTGGLVATLYASGGAAEWGGRFFLVLLPILVPVAMLGLQRAGGHLPALQRRIALGCAIAVTAALSFSALRVQSDIRTDAAATIDGTEAFAAEMFPGESTLVVIATMEPSGNSRRFWESDGSVEVIEATALGTLPSVVEQATEAGREHVLVLTDADRQEFGNEVGASLGALDWTVEQRTVLAGTDSRVLVLRSS